MEPRRALSVVFGVIIGTGTGGGIVVNGKVVEGRNRIAGEWGHNPLPWPRDNERPGSPCYCGRTGCIETFISGPALSASYAAVSQEWVDASEIAGRAEAGERFALKALEVYEERLARALASIINVLDPDVIVLGGGLSNIRRSVRQRAGAVAAFCVLGFCRYTSCTRATRRFQRRPRRRMVMEEC